MLMVFMNLYIYSLSIYTKDISNLKTEKRAVLELWYKVKVCHETINLLICTWYCIWYLYCLVSNFL